MDADRLSVFRAVAHEGGFTRAARVLHRTQPAISQAVRALEDELGEKLFIRSGRQTSLTQAGRVFLEHVDDAFVALEHGRARLASLRNVLEGELSIGTSDTTACYVLPRVLAVFRERYPGVELRISNRPSPVTVEQVLSREVDIGFVTLPARHAGIASEELLTREDVAIVSVDHPLAKRKRIRFADLLHHPLLLLDPGSQTRRFIDERIAETGIQPNIAMELAGIELIKRLVALGFGASIVPAIAVQDELAAGTLVAHRVLPRSQHRKLGAIYSDRNELLPAARAFLELAREGLA